MHTRYMLLFTIAFVLISLCAIAQPQAALGPWNSTAHTFMQAQNANGQTNASAKTASTGSRLISQAHLKFDPGNGTYSLRDSFTYDYPGNRGGYQNGLFEWVWLYDTNHYYHFEEGYIFWEPIRSIQIFDPKNNIARYEYQRYDTVTNIGTTTYEEMYVYDSLNNKVLTKIREWDPHGVWTSSRIIDAYDVYNNLSVQTKIYWNPTTSTWQNGYRYNFTYDLNHNMLTSLEETWNTASSAWDLATGIVYTYDTGNNVRTQLYQSWNGTSWENDWQILFSNFTMHQPGIAVYTDWNGTSYDTGSRRICTYNSYGQPLMDKTEQWLGNGWWPGTYDYLTRYHYETYITDVPTIILNNANVIAYPVPAKDELTITVSWDKPQPFSVTLMDVTGKLYTRQNISTCAKYKDNISVADLPAGNYIINIEGTSGKTTRKISVVK